MGSPIPSRKAISKYFTDARTNPYFRERITTLASLALLNLVFLTFSKNVFVVAIADFLIFGVPMILWGVILRVVPRRFLKTFLVDRRHRRFIPKGLQQKFLPERYFLAMTRFPRKLWWRIFQLLFLTFFLSSLSVPHLPLLSSPTAVNEVVEFALLGVLFIAVLGPFLAIEWTYEDWGLRGYDNVREIVYPIGSTLFNYITGFGAVGSLIKFLISLNISSAQDVGTIMFLLFFLLPPCLWMVVRFHVFQEKKVIRKLKDSDVGNAIFMKSISIE
jgi:hypothetical protein